jgi:hypothetical protein
MEKEATASKESRKHRRNGHRGYLIEYGMVRFKVLGLKSDRNLIRALALRLAEGGTEADQISIAVSQSIGSKPLRTGHILAALRSSPLVGVALDLARPYETGRGSSFRTRKKTSPACVTDRRKTDLPESIRRNTK